MRAFLILLFSLLAVSSVAQPPMLRGPGTTNSPFVQLYSLPVFNVVNYGATPGRTYATVINDLVPIQAAITDASTNGGRVYFPPGVYGLGTNYVFPTYLTEAQPSSLIIPSNNVFLYCDSPGSATLTQIVFLVNNMIGSGSDTPASGPTNVGLVNLRLNGKTADGRDLTQFQRTYNTFFENCIFENAGADAIDVQSGGSVFINNCVFSNIVLNSISAQNPNVFISKFYIDGKVGGDIECFGGKYFISDGAFRNTTNAITVTGSDVVYIDNVEFANPNVNATNIYVGANSECVISRCYFSGGGISGAAICVDTNGQLTVNGCRFSDRGIVAKSPSGLRIRDNIFNTGIISIRIQGGARGIITGNEFVGAVDAIRMSDGLASRNMMIMNNFMAAFCNVYSDNGGTNHMIMNNFFQDSEIRMQGNEANCMIVGNNMRGSSAQLEHAGGLHFITANILRDINFLSTESSTFTGNQIASVSGNATGITNSNFGNIPFLDLLEANITRTDATYANTPLQAYLTISKRYGFRLVLFVSNSTAADGIKVDFNGGTVTTSNFRAEFHPDGTLVTGGSSQTTAISTSTAQTLSGTGNGFLEVTGTIEPSNSGTLVVRTAEQADGGGTLTVFRGSYLVVYERQ